MLKASMDKGANGNVLLISTNNSTSLQYTSGLKVIPCVDIIIQELTLQDIETLLTCLSQKRKELITAFEPEAEALEG